MSNPPVFDGSYYMISNKEGDQFVAIHYILVDTPTRPTDKFSPIKERAWYWRDCVHGALFENEWQARVYISEMKIPKDQAIIRRVEVEIKVF